MMDLEEIAYSDSNLALWDAKEGNYKAMAARLRDKGCVLSTAERTFLADHLEGKFKRRPHRQESWRVEDMRLEVSNYVATLERFDGKKIRRRSLWRQRDLDGPSGR
jgi:hypothetical protein